MTARAHASNHPRGLRAFAAGLALAAAVVTAALGGAAAPAHAAGSVDITVKDRPDLVGVADPNYLTEITATGTGFQSIPNGFGGIYVFFGWVDGGSWAPSQGGSTGTDYRYVYDDEANPVGYQLFVSFPGSSTEYAANGGEVNADGNWSATMRIPGSSFESYDRDGNVTTVDCLQVTCGIITIGAHGVVNPSNESFTPISFRDLYSDDAAAAAAAEAAAAAAPAATTPPAGEGGAEGVTTEEAAPGPVTTTIIAAPAAVDDSGDLVPILLGAVVGVGVLAVAAIGFLVWAVLSSRKRSAAAGTGAAGAGAASAGAAGGHA
ncbi:hypothetical protein N1028_05735 [Herbiconiux sp. CPCC 203407]|uniref:Minor silk ampullate protein n=1 Tax=Herbiconiux oxytropis TaxID=2970915 RepID=A0AA42BT24_9MICO|nr:hypothetical protein [Herbiconiux oxytropis]MCS5722695.1 hypothetical protein [Herbiconiux oxytropis]MCS5725392.1 hypothetical protein [Herbiconiux oxytropis]